MKEQKNNNFRKVIHLHLLDSDIHEYYGSMAALYQYHNAEELGLSYSSLRNYGLSQARPYYGNKCVIRQGVLESRKSKRGANIKQLFRCD